MEIQKSKNQKAFEEFKSRMTDITKRQFDLFLKVDKIVTQEKADKIREKIREI